MIEVYYETLSYEILTESEAYSWVNLISGRYFIKIIFMRRIPFHNTNTKTIAFEFGHFRTHSVEMK